MEEWKGKQEQGMVKDREQSEQWSVRDKESRAAAADVKGVQTIELNCDTLHEVSFIRAVSEMTAGRGSGDLPIPIKGHHDVTKPNENKGWDGPHRDFRQMTLVRPGGHSFTVLRSGAKTTGE